jgi:hypothetical protein
MTKNNDKQAIHSMSNLLNTCMLMQSYLCLLKTPLINIAVRSVHGLIMCILLVQRVSICATLGKATKIITNIDNVRCTSNDEHSSLFKYRENYMTKKFNGTWLSVKTL